MQLGRKRQCAAWRQRSALHPTASFRGLMSSFSFTDESSMHFVRFSTLIGVLAFAAATPLARAADSNGSCLKPYLQRTAAPKSTIFAETADFSERLAAEKNGTPNLHLLPPHRILSLWVKHSDGASGSVEGELLELIRRPGKSTALVLRGDRGPQSVDVSKIVSAEVKRIPTAEELEQMRRQFTEAKQGTGVSVIHQFGKLNETTGVLTRFDPQRGYVTLLLNDTRSEIDYSLSRMDPDSLSFFTAQPRDLTPTEQALWAKIEGTKKDKRHIAFNATVASDSGEALFEGVIDETGIHADGERWVKLSEGSRISLKNILGTVEVEPKLQAIPPFDGPKRVKFSAHLAPIENEGKPYTLTEQTVGELAAFAQMDRSVGRELPAQLKALPRGQEVRIYFEVLDRKVRLTIRHNDDGTWSFGETAFDLRNEASETYRNLSPWERQEGGANSRYALNEGMRLTRYSFTEAEATVRLRSSMRGVSDVLRRTAVEKHYAHRLEELSRSLPEFYRDPLMSELLLKEQGQTYHLNQGFMEANVKLTGDERKLLSAVYYLTAQKMVFWSSNAGGSKVASGIYPLSGPGSVKISMLHLAGVDMKSQLFKAMEKRGLHFDGNSWK